MERWLSGLRRTIGNRVTANTRTGVQIPVSPPARLIALIQVSAIFTMTEEQDGKIMDEKITIQQIAEKANVSIATVSRIINHKGPVKESTRQKVLQIMDEYNFQPKTGQGSNRDAKTILVYMPDFQNPFNASAFEGIQKSAQAAGYQVLILQDTQNDYQRLLKHDFVTGIIVLTSSTQSTIIDEVLNRYPVVVCSGVSKYPSVSSVCTDNFSAAKRATEYLISCNRKKVALLNSSPQFNYSQQREAGFRQAMSDAGLPVNESWVVRLSTINFNIAASNMLHLFQQPDYPNAVFAVSDMYAAGTIQAAKQAGLRVPEDVAVIGFDNTEICLLTDPPITAVSQPIFELGFQACELLLERIDYPGTGAKQIVLDTELIVRSSTPLNLR